MPGPLIAGIAGSVASAAIGKSASKSAANAAIKSSADQITESRRQFDLLQGLMKPYVSAGNGALQGQLNLMGQNGAPAQASAIANISNGENFKALTAQGEQAILANASATGGLRGGNTEGALAQYRPAMLQSLIQQQLAGLGGIAANGQNAAGMTGTAAQNSGAQVISALDQRGAALGGSALAGGQAMQNGIGGILQTLGGLSQPMAAGAGAWQKWKF